MPVKILVFRKSTPARISIVVKEQGDELYEKLVLLTSKEQVLVAKPMNRPFSGSASVHKNTLVLALHATDKSGFTVSVFPKNQAARQYRLNYDSITRTIVIPSGLLINRTASTDIFGNDSAPAHAGMEYEPNIGAQSLQLANIQVEMRIPKLATTHDHVIPDGDCPTCFGAYHSNDCGRSLVKNCFDCHLPTFKYTYHGHNCSAKWYTSERTNAYVQIPSERCMLTFKAPIQVLLDGQLKMAQKELGMFSAMSDSYFKFESDRRLKVMTTDYSRIRIPLIAMDGHRAIEKLVVMTSYDRSVIVAKGSRNVGDDPLGEHKYNTPIVLYFADQPADVSIEVHSEGGVTTNSNIEYIVGQNRFSIPKELDLNKKMRWFPQIRRTNAIENEAQIISLRILSILLLSFY